MFIHSPSPHPGLYGHLGISVRADSSGSADTCQALNDREHPVYPGTSPSPSCFLLPSPSAHYYELQVILILNWTGSCLCLCSYCVLAKFSTAPVCVRVDDTTLLCQHGSSTFCPYSFRLFQLCIGGALDVDQYLPILLTTLYVRVWCVCECSFALAMLCTEVRGQAFESGFLFHIFFSEAEPLLLFLSLHSIPHLAGL